VSLVKKVGGQEVAFFRQNSDRQWQISYRDDYWCSKF